MELQIQCRWSWEIQVQSTYLLKCVDDLGLGTFKYETPKGSGCREYYFHFIDYKGDSFYYPETGSLVTFNVHYKFYFL